MSRKIRAIIGNTLAVVGAGLMGALSFSANVYAASQLPILNNAKTLFIDVCGAVTIFNLTSGDVMFGEYLGTLPEDEDEAREVIWRDFLDGCKHITYPDGYMVDDLYEMIDFF